MPAPTPSSTKPTRRAFLIGGGAAAGLALAFSLWPRSLAPNLVAGPGDTILDAYLKIGADGRVIVAVPQVEMGQGIWTALPQALADELGADWRQIAVEPAPPGPIYANHLLVEELAGDRWPAFGGIARIAADRWADNHALAATAGSTSIRAFEPAFRAAGATARAMLCMAAAKRLGIDWRACDTVDGFVVRGTDRFRFGELAAEAAGFSAPDPAPLRKAGAGRLSGRSVARLDLPAKIDGSARFAGDVRLPGMVFAAIRHGPLGKTTVAGLDEAAASKVPGAIGLVRRSAWVAAVASNSWAAQRMLDAAGLRFATTGTLPDTASIDRALTAALAQSPKPLVTIGDVGVGAMTLTADYAVPLSPHATIEPLVATARPIGDRLELWLATQSPSLARSAVARATGVSEGRITVYPMPVGGGFGRKIELDAAIEAATIALEIKRPVQLTWSRAEEMQRGRHRPPAVARLAARIEGRRIAAWRATIASPAAVGGLIGRMTGDDVAVSPERPALDGAQPPYAIPALALVHAPAAIGIETGLWRSGAREANCFFAESFVDELALKAGIDPLGFRMSQLGGDARLARCLSRVAAAGGWSGETGAAQGLAIHSAYGSRIALLAEATPGERGPKVGRLVAVVDCGRVIHPDIAQQQIESGLVWGLASALGGRIDYSRGLAEQHGLDALHPPRLVDMPEIVVEFITSAETPGGLAELAVPVVAPAIANAIASGTGRRLRALPLLA